MAIQFGKEAIEWEKSGYHPNNFIYHFMWKLLPHQIHNKFVLGVIFIIKWFDDTDAGYVFMCYMCVCVARQCGAHKRERK